MPSLLTSDTLNPSLYGTRVIAHGLEPVIDELMAKKSKGRKDKLPGSSKAKPSSRGNRKTKRGAAVRLERARRRKDMRESFAEQRASADGALMQ